MIRRITPIVRPPAKRIAASGSAIRTSEEMAEWLWCSPLSGFAGFAAFCDRHVWIQDKVSGGEARFILWPGQRRIARLMVLGLWLLCLKGRQTGFTWLAAAYCLWRLIYTPLYLAAVINQKKEYAQDFKRRVLWMYARLPPFLQLEITKDDVDILRFERERHGAELRVLVGDEDAGRSFTGNLAIVDEASRVPNLGPTLTAMLPAMAHGQVMMITTSAGPTGEFHNQWTKTYGTHGELLNAERVGPTGFRPEFIHWSERPGRDRAWYEAEKRRLDQISPVAVKQEHPDTIEEAWEHAAGRVYPLFASATHVGDIAIPPHAERYRFIDWGETRSAYVVLWAAYIPGPPGFLVSPQCPNTIREFLSYRLDEEPPHHPLKENDHTCDAVRYGVTTCRLRGLVYVYREVYRTDSLERGWNPMKEIEEIHTLSGWRLTHHNDRERWRPGRDGERFVTTVCDRSWGKAIAQLREFGIPARPAVRLRGPKVKGGQSADRPESEILEGVRQVSALIEGTHDLDRRVEVTRERLAIETLREEKRSRVKAASSLQRRELIHLAKALLESDKARKGIRE